MIKRVLFVTVLCGLAVGLIGLGRATSQGLDSSLSRYPGSMQIADDVIDWHTLKEGSLRFQGTYQTPDALPVVRGWYAAHLNISPASDQYLLGADGCAWLTQSNLIWRLQRTVAVLLCPIPAGTRVVVNESVEVEP